MTALLLLVTVDLQLISIGGMESTGCIDGLYIEWTECNMTGWKVVGMSFGIKLNLIYGKFVFPHILAYVRAVGVWL